MLYYSYIHCRSKYGVVATCFGEGDLELYPGSIDLSVDGWKNDKTISLHEAARLSNPLNEFHGGICKCGAQCATKVCPCRKKGAPCSTKCHGGRKCSNTCTQPTKENQTTNSTEGKQTSKSSIPQDKRASPSTPADDKQTTTSPWLSHLFLDQRDKEECENGDWLTDKHMWAAQHLLKKQFPHLSGLQLTILKETGQWDIMASDGIQILNQTNTHWLCVTTIGCVQGEVSIYDSKLNKKKVHTEISQQIASFSCTQAPHITLRVMHCQGQSGESDCGLYAIATATSLAYGIPPSCVL